MIDDDEDDGFCPLCQRRPADAEGMCGVCFERQNRCSTLDQWDEGRPDWSPWTTREWND